MFFTMVSGRNTLENAYKVTLKSKFSTQNVQIPYYLHPALSYNLPAQQRDTVDEQNPAPPIP